MGQALPRAVDSVVLERQYASGFTVGTAEMNGWRPGMEDAHCVVMGENWGFFAVFDGHGGDQCSQFVAKRMKEEVSERGKPYSDEASIRDLVLKIDQEFIKMETPSGSTATFVFVIKGEDGKVKLLVGNIGDSRVLLSAADGTIRSRGGTDGCLTIDHKPDNPDEIKRIQANGGTIETVMGVPRVNGDLAVSRSFGDADHKKNESGDIALQPVTALPEVFQYECEGSDFLLLVCDGVSEGSFPNASVCQVAAMALRESGGDPGIASKKVVETALAEGSKDNISCMCVLLHSTEEAKRRQATELMPGFFAYSHDGYRAAYTAMAARAGTTLDDAVTGRIRLVLRDQVPKQDCSAFLEFVAQSHREVTDENLSSLVREWVEHTRGERAEYVDE
eukprot:TRINITY_DN4406_c0_g1_i1.p1 TRINITY_DN4406_c0_g1~~TRINITY_DN4406_c0_g1_i1.p1  ORF type:complete len:391 (+),score=86.91 TRINITY_DN4406_c0_g1_i1:76-1248(+)